MRKFPDAAWIVFILAVSIGITMLIFSATILYEVIDHEFISELPPNALQFLIGIFGGALGIIGAYVGYSAAKPEEELEIDTDATVPEPEIDTDTTV